jgi:hypothetical protein
VQQNNGERRAKNGAEDGVDAVTPGGYKEAATRTDQTPLMARPKEAPKSKLRIIGARRLTLKQIVKGKT